MSVDSLTGRPMLARSGEVPSRCEPLLKAAWSRPAGGAVAGTLPAEGGPPIPAGTLRKLGAIHTSHTSNMYSLLRGETYARSAADPEIPAGQRWPLTISSAFLNAQATSGTSSALSS